MKRKRFPGIGSRGPGSVFMPRVMESRRLTRGFGFADQLCDMVERDRIIQRHRSGPRATQVITGRIVRSTPRNIGRDRINKLLREGQRRVLARAFIGEPLFPFGRVVRPLLPSRCTRPAAQVAAKKVLRCSRVRQRGMAVFACATSDWVSGKMSQMRAVLSLDAVTMRLSVGTERRAIYLTFMASEFAIRLTARWRPTDAPSCRRRRGDDALRRPG